MSQSHWLARLDVSQRETPTTRSFWRSQSWTLTAVGTKFDEAEELMKDALEYYDVDDIAVYGGGLYI